MKLRSYRLLVTKPSTRALVQVLKKPSLRSQTNSLRLVPVTKFPKRSVRSRYHRTYTFHRSSQWQHNSTPVGRRPRLLGSQVPNFAVYAEPTAALSTPAFAGANSLLAINSVRLLWMYLQSTYGVNHVKFLALPLMPVSSRSPYQIQRLIPTDFLAFKGLRRTVNTVRSNLLLSLYNDYNPTHLPTEVLTSGLCTSIGTVRTRSQSFLAPQLELGLYRDLNSKLRTAWLRTVRVPQSFNVNTSPHLGDTKGAMVTFKPKLSLAKPLPVFFTPVTKPTPTSHFLPASTFRTLYNYLNPRIKRSKLEAFFWPLRSRNLERLKAWKKGKPISGSFVTE